MATMASQWEATMNNQRLLKDAAAINALAQLLMRCPEVTQHDQDQHIEAGAIAHAFSDLEESFHIFLEEHLPRLTKGQLKPSELRDLLLDIGEEFRHILYHIKAPKFYSYLQD
jgi:hypothetical protein